jgi:type II secretory pathway component PulF
MILTYQAITSDGKHTRDTVEAADTRQAIDQLRHRGLFVTEIRQSDAGKSREASGPPSASTPSGRLPIKTLAVFTRQMAMLLHAGSGIVPAIAAIKRQLRKPAHVALLSEVVSDLEAGMTLTDALRKHPRSFDSVYCAVIAAGEASAGLTQMFERLAVLVAKQRALRNKIIGTLAYPALLIAMSTSILNAMLFFVIPRFNDMFVQLGVQPPATTKLLLGVAAVLTGYWPFVLGGVLLTLGALVALVTSRPGRRWLSNVQLAIPMFGTLRARMIQVQVFRTMGMLLESGVSVLDSLHLVRRSTESRRFQNLFDHLEQSVTSGGRFSTAFDESGLIEPHICQAITTGEESGNIGGALTYCTEILDETNTEVINTLMRLLEPLILIGMGLIVGGVAVSLFLPLFDMTAAMR